MLDLDCFTVPLATRYILLVCVTGYVYTEAIAT